MNFQPLKYIYRSSGNPEANTLLLLHGTGGDETDLLSLADEFGTGFNILSLRGNVLEGGMPRFFKRLSMGVFDEKDIAFRTDEMVSFINELSVKEGFNSSKIIALGYSNGANIAGATLLKYPDFFAGAILFRPMQPFKQVELTASTISAPLFLSSGKFDPTVDPNHTQAYLSLLEQAGFEVNHYEIGTSHNLTQEDVRLAVEWFNKRFGHSVAS